MYCSVLRRNFGRDDIFLQVTAITDLSQCSPQDWGGGTGVRARRWEKCLGLLTFCYYSSPLGKEVKQERNLSGRKQKTKKNIEKREEGKTRKKSGE